MARWFDRGLGLSGARAVASTLGPVVAAGAALAVALGGKPRTSESLRIALIVFGALALLVAVAVGGLTLAEQTAGGRARARRLRGWVEVHFGPRGRGVARKGERGEYFTGRTRALHELVGWLRSDRGGSFVVTGDPGSGKSAVLGRVVALADRGLRRDLGVAGLPADILPPEGSIDVAVWTKGLTMGDVIDAIAAMIGPSASAPDELVDAVLARGRPLVVVVDALDEASGEGEARRIAQRLLKPLAAAGRESGVKVLVGTRRGAGGELLNALGSQKRVIDLDTPEYLERDDLVDYVRRRLLRDGEPGAPTPYRKQPAVASQIAQAVADRASPSFLIAQLASRSLADADEVVNTTEGGWETRFPADVGSAMDDYLDRFEQESDRRRARDLLTALAYAEGVGLPRDEHDLWPHLASALAGKAYDGDDIDWVLHTAAADLIDHTTTDGTSTYRLFHQALSDHLRGPAERQRGRQRTLADALEGAIPTRANDADRDWARAGTYVRTHLATHAAAAGVLDHLLEDPEYLVVADPLRLRRALPAATSPAATNIRRGYRPIAHLLQDARPAERAAYLEMAARRVGATLLAGQIAQRHPDRPWTVPWMRWRASSEHVLAGRHDGAARAVAVGKLDGRPIAVSGGDDTAVRVWDLAAGQQLGAPLTGHDGAVRTVAVGALDGRPIELDGRPIAVSGGSDGTVRVWDLAAGQQLGAPLTGHDSWVTAVAVGELDGRPIAVSGGLDGTVRVWDLAAGQQLGAPLTGHDGAVRAVAVGELDGRPIAVSGGDDRTVRVWDMAAGQQLGAPLTGHDGAVRTVAVGELDGRPIAVSGGDDGTVRVWDLAAGQQLGAPLTGHDSWVTAVAVGELDGRPIELDGRPIAVSGGDDGTVRVWDLAAGQQLGAPLTGHDSWVTAVAVGELDGRPIAVSGGVDGTVRVWDLAAGQQLGAPLTGHDGAVRTVAVGELDGRPIELDGRPIAVSGGSDGTVRVWDLAAGQQLGAPLTGHDGAVRTVAVGELDGRPIAVSGGVDGTVRVWDMAAGQQLGEPLTAHVSWVTAVAVGELDGRPIAVSGGVDGTVRVWDLAAGQQLGAPLTGHDSWVTAVAVGELDGRPIAVSGGVDGTVRVWDLAAGQQLGAPLTGHDGAVRTVAVGEPDGRPIELDGRPIAVSGGDDRTVRVWDLAAGQQLGAPLTGHDGAVRTVAVGELDGRPIAVSCSEDATVRVWDPAGFELSVINVGSEVRAVAVRGGTTVVGARAGVMAIEFRTSLESTEPPRSAA